MGGWLVAIISDLGFKTPSCDIGAQADCIVVVVVADRAMLLQVWE